MSVYLYVIHLERVEKKYFKMGLDLRTGETPTLWHYAKENVMW